MRLIDNLLNRFTMYQVTLYALIFYVAYSVLLGFLRIISFTPLDIAISITITLSFCWISNFIFAKVFNAVTNFESVFITALILTLIVPAQLPLNAGFLVVASVLAMAIKYFPTINKRHLINPAAGAVAAYSLLFPNYIASWWIGTPAMIIPVLVGGFLVVRKAQRQEMALTFLGVFMSIVVSITFVRFGTIMHILDILKVSIIQSGVIFFSTIMLTEPITSTSTRKLRTYYAVIVSLLYATPQLRFLGLILTPEQALIFGNVFSYIVNPKYNLSLPLSEIQRLSPTIYAFLFPKEKSFTFTPGQYMEWTLPHPHMDPRGNRRFLSLASSPTEDNILAVIRYYTPPSSYKHAMVNMKKGDLISAINLSGDFVLPKNLKKPIAFVAGGVGITPFRSMVKYIIDKNLSANIVLVFINKTPDEIIFKEVFNNAEKFGVKTIYHTTSEDGKITPEIFNRDIPDYKSRTFYLSGSQLMIQDIEAMLKRMGVHKIKTDFFPGYSE